MEFYKILLFLLINLINLDFNMAEQSNAQLLNNNAEHATYNKFPFGFIFGRYLEGNVGKNLSHRLRKEAEIEDKDLDGNKGRAVYWIPTSCDSLAERGYTCLSCGESLHCMGGNFALKAICGGRRPFCSNGVCSDIRGTKCRRDDDNHASASPAIQHDHPQIQHEPHVIHDDHDETEELTAESANNATLT